MTDRFERQRRFPSDLEFRNHLAQFGFTPETLRENLATELLAQAYSQSVVGEITISDADLKATYEANIDRFRRPTSRCSRPRPGWRPRSRTWAGRARRAS